MAKLRIEVYALTSEHTVDDATAALVLENYALATGANPAATSQEKLDHVRLALSEYFVRLAMDEARVQAEADFGF